MALILFRSLGYSKECLGLHMGALHGADLGDGDGVKTQQVIARQHYFPIWGTCWESLAGKFCLYVFVPRLIASQEANTLEHGSRTAPLPIVVPGT